MPKDDVRSNPKGLEQLNKTDLKGEGNTWRGERKGVV